MKNPINPQKPVRSYKNIDFLNSPAARAIRVQCEFLEPEQRFRQHNIKHTLVVFGSARIPNTDDAARALQAAENAVQANNTPENQKALRSAKALMKAAPWHNKCIELTEKFTQWSNTLEDETQRVHVMSGGGPGIMEAANRGAYQTGGKSIGLGISLPFEQSINDYCSEGLGMEFHYFFIRKYWFLYMAKAIVVCPGGFGTMDELFEMLTLIQTKKTHKQVPIVLFGSEFWNKLINFETFIEWGVISPEDVNLFKIMDDVDDTVAFLKRNLKENYNIG